MVTEEIAKALEDSNAEVRLECVGYYGGTLIAPSQDDEPGEKTVKVKVVSVPQIIKTDGNV